MSSTYDILLTLMRTEKGVALEKARQYVFSVATTATKIDIKKAVEAVYKVKVQAVNVTNVPGKKKRVRQKLGYASDWKKAVVTLKAGSKIEVA